jgi:hypothetical protein
MKVTEKSFFGLTTKSFLQRPEFDRRSVGGKFDAVEIAQIQHKIAEFRMIPTGLLRLVANIIRHTSFADPSFPGRRNRCYR